MEPLLIHTSRPTRPCTAMAVLLVFLAACLLVDAAPPSPGFFPQSPLQQNPLDYYLDNQREAGYYQQQQKQASEQRDARLETLEPDSEVELVPGVQQPQQPPQQNPVAPNIPGLIPGQRVFIVHMPIPGYSPGSIGGYQPVYIVAAAPQGNAGYPGNGYQNGVLVDPAQGVYPGQAAVYPGQGSVYPGQGSVYPGQASVYPGQGAVYPGQGNLLYRTPLLYPQDPNLLAYQPAGQLVGVPVPQSPVAAKQVDAADANSKNAQIRIETKANEEGRQHSARPAPPHSRNKA